MTCKLFTLFILFFVSIQVISAMKCYRCASLDECKRDEDDIDQLYCGKDHSCFKIDNKDGKTTEKNCLVDSKNNWTKEKEGCKKQNDGSNRCICNWDLCNSSVHFGSSFGSFFLIAIAFFVNKLTFG